LLDPPATYKLEQSTVSLSKGGKTTMVYAIPSRIRDPASCLIVAHGAGGPMHSPFVRFFHTELARNGFISLKFNFPYMEAHRKVPDRREILEDSYSTIIQKARDGNPKPRRIFIGGKSMGGRIASQVVASDKVDVDGLFFLGYPLHPPGKTEQLRDQHLYKIRKPMLFLSGTRDSFARKDLLEKVVAKIGPSAQIHWIENGDHSFKTADSRTGGSSGTEEALAYLLEWLEKMSPSKTAF
jgi:uncharacterized protein